MKQLIYDLIIAQSLYIVNFLDCKFFNSYKNN